MYYIIQENLFREFHFKTLTDILKRHKLEYEIIKFIPFTDELEFKTTRKDVLFLGSSNGSLLAAKYGWNPGSFWNDQHDLEVYSLKYYGHMLNWDYDVINIGEDIPACFSDPFFARPTMDTKSFSGAVHTKEEWKKWLGDLADDTIRQNLTKETKVFIAPVKEGIQQEIRCWIVDGKPVTISQYKIGNRVNYLNMDHNEEAVIFSSDMAKLFSPARAFVLDICLYEDEYKVVEINNLNSSGFYDANMSKLIQALENKFGTQEEQNRSNEIINDSFKDRNY